MAVSTGKLPTKNLCLCHFVRTQWGMQSCYGRYWKSYMSISVIFETQRKRATHCKRDVGFWGCCNSTTLNLYCSWCQSWSDDTDEPTPGGRFALVVGAKATRQTITGNYWIPHWGQKGLFLKMKMKIALTTQCSALLQRDESPLWCFLEVRGGVCPGEHYSIQPDFGDHKDSHKNNAQQSSRGCRVPRYHSDSNQSH